MRRSRISDRGRVRLHASFVGGTQRYCIRTESQ